MRQNEFEQSEFSICLICETGNTSRSLALAHVKVYHRDYLEYNSAASFVLKDELKTGIYLPNIMGRHKMRDLLFEAYNRSIYL